MQAGAFDQALELLATAEAGPLDEFAAAPGWTCCAAIAFASGSGGDAPPLLLKAARRLEPLDLGLARETYLSAWGAAVFAGRPGRRRRRCVESPAPPGPSPAPAHPPRPLDLLLDGLALLVTDGPAAAAPTLRRASGSSPAPTSPPKTGCGGAGWPWPPPRPVGLPTAARAIIGRGRSSSPATPARLTSCRSTCMRRLGS